jgi:hypothetical protein
MAKKEVTKKNDPKIELIETAVLIPYARNSRLHSEKQIDQIASSIREFGFLNAIVIDKDNGLIAGHGRLEAAKKLGLEKVPCIRADHLTEAQKKAYVIADNRLAELSSWDNDMLKIELEDLVLENFDINLIGFDDDYVNSLLNPIPENTDENIYTDKIEIPIYEPKGDKPKLNELYDLDKTNKLIEKIKNSNIESNEKLFLIEAAKRHTVFNYQNIAEYYAHANKEVQCLMEESALVIIDFNKAIEYGFIKMTKNISEVLSD